MEAGQFPAAEKVYRAALQKSPRLPRALAGLRDSLRAQNRVYEAQQIEQQMNKLSSSGALSVGKSPSKSSGNAD
jgi:thioredoxin-like negative regulator of GroEL